jgi:leukotriene-A4 hydrolase
MHLLVRASVLLLLVLGACHAGRTGRDAPPATAAAPILATPDAVDPHSYARPLEARVTHVALDLDVDFAAKAIAGTATLDIDRKPGAATIILDDNGLRIASIADGAGRPLQWKVGASNPEFGAPLTVALRPDTRRLMIKYASAPEASALLWLTPQQTAGKKLPFLFSQGQAINNRSWIPTQDSPGIRQTWEARISVAKPLTVVMSAPSAGEPTVTGNKRSFRFKMANSVAPYMIALAVGDLSFRPLGPRTGVWAEPAMLPAASRELEDSEKMVAAAEALYGPYRWGRYDMLVLPPAFPFGGMENPVMTFLTPTFIAGDKSLVSLVAHELAHSWSGNLATNATWNDFWLNEGITTYAERRIVERLYGKQAADRQIVNGLDVDLADAIAEAGGPDSPDTRLRLDLKGRHPDDGTSNVAYEKGAALLRTIEAAVGRERFDPWLRGWIGRHAFQPVTTNLFLADLRQHLIKGDTGLEARLMLDRWIDQPGIPPNIVRPPATVFAAPDAGAAAFARGEPPSAAWHRWTTDERLRFLNRLPRALAPERLAALERAYGLNRIANMEVRFAWLDLAVANRFDPAVPSLEQFLAAQGRGKFVRPLIQALARDSGWGRPIAARVYARTRPLYHPLVARELDRLNLLPPGRQNKPSAPLTP